MVLRCIRVLEQRETNGAMEKAETDRTSRFLENRRAESATDCELRGNWKIMRGLRHWGQLLPRKPFPTWTMSRQTIEQSWLTATIEQIS